MLRIALVTHLSFPGSAIYISLKRDALKIGVLALGLEATGEQGLMQLLLCCQQKGILFC